MLPSTDARSASGAAAPVLEVLQGLMLPSTDARSASGAAAPLATRGPSRGRAGARAEDARGDTTPSRRAIPGAWTRTTPPSSHATARGRGRPHAVTPSSSRGGGGRGRAVALRSASQIPMPTKPRPTDRRAQSPATMCARANPRTPPSLASRVVLGRRFDAGERAGARARTRARGGGGGWRQRRHRNAQAVKNATETPPDVGPWCRCNFTSR